MRSSFVDHMTTKCSAGFISRLKVKELALSSLANALLRRATLLQFEDDKMPYQEGLYELSCGLGPDFNFGRSCLNAAALYDPEFLTSVCRTLNGSRDIKS